MALVQKEPLIFQTKYDIQKLKIINEFEDY